jgi:hypothetical protein
MTETDARRWGERLFRILLLVAIGFASGGVGGYFHSWSIGFAVGLGLLSLHGIHMTLARLLD